MLGLKPVPYQQRLEDALTKRWGTWEEDYENTAVGEVDQIEIYREVTIYRRCVDN